MLEIKKSNAPDFFDSWIKDKKEHNRQLREFILDNEQTGLCCYCEKHVTTDQDKSHLEHVRPQDKYPQLKESYGNLLVSCQTNGRCGKAKGRQFNERFIVPTEENPGQYLDFSFNGEIRANNDNEKGLETIEILNLNSGSLVKARRVLFKQLESMSASMSIDEFEVFFTEYPSCIRYFKENL